MQRECAESSNVEFLGFQSFAHTEKYFDRCKVFVNTSTHEGFPNTFLQAWRRGIPVISYVDPDGVIERNGLGASVESEEELHAALRLATGGCPWKPETIRRYYTENHSIKVVKKYCALLRPV